MALAQGLGVKNSFFPYEKFPSDNLVPSPGIAFDRNPVDIDKFSLIYIYDYVNQLFFLLGINSRSCFCKGVTVFSIVVVQAQNVLTQDDAA